MDRDDLLKKILDHITESLTAIDDMDMDDGDKAMSLSDRAYWRGKRKALWDLGHLIDQWTNEDVNR